MKTGKAFLSCTVLVLLLIVCGCSTPALQSIPAGSTNSTGAPGIPLGKGLFVFTDSLGNADRPITVYTYRPATWNSSGPILIVMPGRVATASRPGTP